MGGSRPIVLAAAAAVWLAASTPAADWHSFAEPGRIRVRHAALDLAVSFETQTLSGTAVLTLDRAGPGPLTLDTRDLDIQAVDVGGKPARFRLGGRDAIRGNALRIDLPAGAETVRIRYRTQPRSTGLRWSPDFLYTQSWSIHARSWVPIQDTPAVRFTYSAVVRTPPGMRAVMSAANPPHTPPDGVHRFEMRQPVPAYLLALAVGDLAFRPLGPRTGVYARPREIERAAREFHDTEALLGAAEQLCGPYRWERYDMLVQPAGAPYGGMENARLTFLSPTVVAGDRTGTSTVAHEIAHSWAGNLVTPAAWHSVWLSEGIATYIELRVVEAVYGKRRADFEAALYRRGLEEFFKQVPDEEEPLARDLKRRPPEAGLSIIPYRKGGLLLDTLEARYGRPAVDAMLRAWFDRHAFTSQDNRAFLEFARHALDPKLDLDAWYRKPGLPPGAARRESEALARLDAALRTFEIDPTWPPEEKLYFFESLPLATPAERLRELDHVLGFAENPNPRAARRWLELGIANGYAPARQRLIESLLP